MSLPLEQHVAITQALYGKMYDILRDFMAGNDVDGMAPHDSMSMAMDAITTLVITACESFEIPRQHFIDVLLMQPKGVPAPPRTTS